MKTTTLPSNNSMNRSPLRLGFLLNALALAVAWLAPSQLANAQCPQVCDAGTGNTAFGLNALLGDGGFNNTAIGFDALIDPSSENNTGIGAYALVSNTGGFGNTATGVAALYSNSSGSGNTASGDSALTGNTTGSENTATGADALQDNTTGNFNTACGSDSLVFNTIGTENTATGVEALLSNTTGSFNTVSGFQALLKNTIGSGNIALGNGAGRRLTIGDNNIDIGNAGVHAEANTIRIGTVGTQTNTFIAGISGVTVAGGVTVVIDANGHLGTSTSSARFKEAIRPMDKASEAILALKPVTFRYKHDLDPEGIPQFGLVAEEVEKVNPDLVARDEQGKPYTVRYEAVNAMLLNEFLKEHRKVQEEEATIAQLKANVAKQDARAERQEGVVAQQQKQIEALTAGLQKVSAQLEIMKPTPQTVSNNY
jgi:hypothetical protein